MAHAHVTQIPARLGGTAPPSVRHPQVVKRRRMLVIVIGLIVVILGVFANYPSLHAYVDVRERLDRANASIEELSALKAELQAELGRLSQADYLESLARQDLSYTRPGEELFIVTGGSSSAVSTPSSSDGSAAAEGTSDSGVAAQSGTPGFMERVLAPLFD